MSTIIPVDAMVYDLNGAALSGYPNHSVITSGITYTGDGVAGHGWQETGNGGSGFFGSLSFGEGVAYTYAGTLLETFSTGGTKQMNAVWSTANPTQATDVQLSSGTGSAYLYQQTYGDFGTYPSTRAGVTPTFNSTVNFVPLAQAMVTQFLGTDSSDTRIYGTVSGAKVDIAIEHLDGRIYKLLDSTLGCVTSAANATNPSGSGHQTWEDHYADSSGTDSTYSILKWNGAADTAHNYGYATPTYAYDPYFGRNPTDTKNTKQINFTLTFPDGNVWKASISCVNNSQNFQGRLSTTLYPTRTAPGGTTISPYGTGTTQIGINYLHYKQSQTALQQVISASGPTERSLVIPIDGICFLFVLQPGWDSGTIPGPSTGPTVASMSLAYDAARRPLALVGGTFKSSKDAGHTYDSYTVTSATAVDPSLLVDRRCNIMRAIYTDAPVSGVANFYQSTSTHDGEQSGDWAASATVPGLTGAYPCVAQHPTDQDRALAVTLDGGVLKSFVSYAWGKTFAALNSSIDTGLDFSSAGRAGLCWLGGETCLVIYASGNNLLARKSIDGGKTFAAAVTIASSGPYSGISGGAHLGTAFATGTVSGVAKVWTTGDLGANWTLDTSPTAASPVAIDVNPWTSRMRFATTQVSPDSGATWIAA